VQGPCDLFNGFCQVNPQDPLSQIKPFFSASVGSRTVPPCSGASRRVSLAAVKQQSSLTTCLQSQIGRGSHLRGWGTAQVEAAVALSVGVCWGPVRTVVNGTVVARPPWMTQGTRSLREASSAWRQARAHRRRTWERAKERASGSRVQPTRATANAAVTITRRPGGRAGRPATRRPPSPSN
jgi:hypothetical protein